MVPYITAMALPQGDPMKRREFISLIGGAAAVWPLAARAQQPTIPVIGFLNGTSAQGYGHFVSSFRQGLIETGYIEGQNVTIEYRWAEGHYERLPALAADLVGLRVAVLVATSTPANVIAKKATTEIPVVFTTSSDPVELGLVASLDRPGGNLTGAVTLNVEVVSKRLELLHEMVPTATVVAVLVNPTNPNARIQSAALQAAAHTIGLQIETLNATTESEIDAAFAQLAERRTGALLVDTDAFLFSRRAQLVGLAKRNAISAIFDRREYAEAGGLVSYGGSVEDVYRLAGVYTGRILKGEKPADLPVIQSTKLQLIVNLKTANTLGMTVPPSLLARADEVIE
jgi:putative tryptophan/tyrosine transport system substrate-binding protein